MKIIYDCSIFLLTGTLIYGMPTCDSSKKRFVVAGSNCKEYYSCENGKLRKEACPRDQLFDKTLLTCEWDELVKDCKATTLSKCPEPNGAFVKPGSYCQKYLECKNNIAFEKSCPYGEMFDEISSQCDWEENIVCTDKDPLCLKADGKFLIKDTECQQYVICKKGKSSIKTCPENHIFDVEYNICDWKEIVNCIDEMVSTATSSTVFQYSMTDNVYKTTHGETISSKQETITSDLNEITSSDILTTTLPTTHEEVTTVAISTSVNNNNLTATYEITNEPLIQTKSSKEDTNPADIISSTQTFKITSTTTDSNGVISKIIDTTTLSYSSSSPKGCVFGDESCKPDLILCPEKHGEFPHPDIPTIFIHCDHWRPYIKECPSGLHFDPMLKVCDWPKM